MMCCIHQYWKRELIMTFRSLGTVIIESERIDNPIVRVCDRCGSPIPHNSENSFCEFCYRRDPIDGTILNSVRNCTLYVSGEKAGRGFMDNGRILDLKDGNTMWTEYYGREMARWFERYGLSREPAFVVPIPKRSSSGRDAAQRLAKKLSEISGVRYEDCLVSTKARHEQKGLTRNERRENSENSMACNRKFNGETIYVIDDVLTTGFTMKEAACNLKRAGASNVVGLVAARDVSYEHLMYNVVK